MAKNWKVGEAVRAIQSGNKEDILDIGRRFPLFANLAAQVNEAGASIIDCVPEYCTARKIESVLKGDVQEISEEDGEETTENEEPKKSESKKSTPKKLSKKSGDEGDDLESKSAKELYDMCKEAGLKVKPKQDKSTYIDALKNADSDEDDGWDDEEEEETPKKSTKKTPAKKAPAKKTAENDDEDDDWEV